MVTAPDFSVPHTQFWCLWKEDPLGFTIHHPSELIMLKNIKSYRHWSALIKIVPHWLFFLFHIKIHEISPEAIQKSNGLKVTCLMSLYFKSEEDTMKNEITAAIFLVPPPFCLRKNIYQIIEGFYYKLFSHYTCHCSFSIIKQYTES